MGDDGGRGQGSAGGADGNAAPTAGRSPHALLRRAVLCCVALALVSFATRLTALRADRLLRAELVRQAHIVAAMLHPVHLSRLTGRPSDAASENYQHVKAHLARARQSIPRCRFVYLTGRDPQGRVFFYVDSEPSHSADCSPPGQIYEDASPDLVRAFAESTAGTEGPLQDEWGTWVTAFVPVGAVAAEGAPVVLGADVAAQDWWWIVGLRAAVPAALACLAALLALLALLLFRAHRGASAREATLRLQALVLAQIQDLVTVTDLQGRITYVNEAECRRMKRPLRELVGKSVEVYGEDPARGATQQEIIERTREDGQWRGEIVNYAADGERIVMDCRTRVVHDADGRQVALCGIATDITQRKQAEDALRRSEAILNASQQLSKVGGWQWDLDTRTMHWTDETYRIHGLEPGEIDPGAEEHIARSAQCYAPGDSEHVLAAFRRCAETGEPYDLEFPFTTHDGRQIWIRTTAQAVVEEGQVRRVIGTLMDITDRKEAEEALKASEERFRAVFEQTAVGIAVTALDGTHLDCNAALLEMLGLSREEFLAMDTGACTHPEDREPDPEPWRQLLAGRRDSYRREVRYIHKQGHVVWARLTVSLALDGQGVPYGTISVVEDVTEQKRTQEALARSEAMYQSLFENMVSAFAFHEIVLDESNNPVDYVFLDVNTAFTTLTGLSREQTVGRRVTEILPGTEPAWIETYGRVALTGEPVSFEAYHGEIGKWYAVSAYSPEPGTFACTFEDVTKRKQAEEALAAETERLAVTLRSIGDAVIATDTSGCIALMNPVAEQLTGWSEEEARGRGADEVFRIVLEGTRETAKSPITEALDTGRTVGLANHTVLISRSGCEYQIADSAAPIRDAGGAFIGVVLVFRDVTEEYRLREEVLKVQKLEGLGNLAGGIAHDFNNALMAIMSNVQFAAVLADDAEKRDAALQRAENACVQATALTQQLLTFARGGAPVKALASIAQIVTDTAQFCLSGSDVSAEFSTAPDLRPVEVDAGQISQVISNLVINAREAMPGGGALKVALANATVNADSGLPLAQGDYVTIAVTDEGIGIPEAHLPNVFDPYFSTKQRGSGLGLATAYSVVRRHEGHIEVSSALGEGATFTVYLPASELAPSRPGQADESLPRGSGRVLVMDDDPDVADATCNSLRSLGHIPMVAREGEEALKLYRQAHEEGRPFAVVMLDLTIRGGLGGAETMRRLLEIAPHARAVVCSGYSADPIMSNYRDYGFRGVLRKPYSLRELAALMNDLTAGDVA